MKCDGRAGREGEQREYNRGEREYGRAQRWRGGREGQCNRKEWRERERTQKGSRDGREEEEGRGKGLSVMSVLVIDAQ